MLAIQTNTQNFCVIKSNYQNLLDLATATSAELDVAIW